MVPFALPLIDTVVNSGSSTVFHFKGIVDGSDKLVIMREGAFWDHVNWDWPPQPVVVNGIQWNVREKAYLTTGNGTEFLPENFSLERVELEIIQGRDIIALERSEDALIVYMNDTLLGSSEYEFKLAFHPASIASSRPQTSATAQLTIAAQIDGSDFYELQISFGN